MAVTLPENAPLLVFELLVECEWKQTKPFSAPRVVEYFRGHTHDPKDLLRLASVSRLAYKYFMDDARWKLFDVYNVQSGIGAHYIEHALAGNVLYRMDLVKTRYPCSASSSLYKLYNTARHNLAEEVDFQDVEIAQEDFHMSFLMWDKHVFELIQGTCCRRVFENTLLVNHLVQ